MCVFFIRETILCRNLSVVISLWIIQGSISSLIIFYRLWILWRNNFSVWTILDFECLISFTIFFKDHFFENCSELIQQQFFMYQKVPCLVFVLYYWGLFASFSYSRLKLLFWSIYFENTLIVNFDATSFFEKIIKELIISFRKK